MYYRMLAVKIMIAIVSAVVLGNGSVVMFNGIPKERFGDVEIPEDREGRQRLPSSPWKYIFVAYFAAGGIFLSLGGDARYELAALVVLFIVLEMAISDAKYRVIPDELNALLALSAIGFIPLREIWWEPFAGAATGVLIGAAVFLCGKLIYKRTDAIGGGDIKFLMAMGLVAGRMGILVIFVMTTIISAIHLMWIVASKRGKLGVKRPMMPYAFSAVTIYMLFMWDFPW